MDLQQFRYYTRWHRHANRRRYDAPADPWRLLAVSPGDVTHCTNELALNWGLGRVQGGDWDQDAARRPVRETTLYRGLKQHFEDGRDWEETALYQRAAEHFERGESFRGYGSLAEFRSVRCEYVDELFRKIEREGYRPNADATHEAATADNAYEDAYAHHLEPLVVIGRSGGVYWTEGYHRFTIASILGVEEIPVNVLCRHEEWQRIRERIESAPGSELPPELDAHRDHPDVQDVGTP